MITSISFVIATSGKRLEMLSEVIKSIRAMAVPDYEIVVVGIVDNIPKDLMATDMKLVTQTLPEKGVKFFWKWGVEQSTKDWIAIVGDDFYFMKSWYDKIKDIDADVIGCKVINPDGTNYFRYADAFDLRIMSQPEMAGRGLTRDTYFSLYLARKAVFDAIPLDPYNMGHDRKFGVECGFLGFKKGFTEDAKIIHLGSPQSMGGSGNIKYAQYTLKERLDMGEVAAAIVVQKCVKCGCEDKTLMVMSDECIIVDQFAKVLDTEQQSAPDMSKMVKE
jgi:hypothetical protein